MTTIFLGALLLVLGVVAIALMWVLSMREAYSSTAREEAERIADERFREMCANTEYRVHYDRYIVCGQGYQTQEDKRIHMTRSIIPEQGGLYIDIAGNVYKCLRVTPDRCSVLMNINTGELLTVRGCHEYQDGKIAWDHCMDRVVLSEGAAVC